jgi:hypothetical protein
VAFTDIDTDSLYSRMFSAAQADDRAAWPQIRTVVKIERKGLARQIKELGKAVSAGDLTAGDAAAAMRLQSQRSAVVVASFSVANLHAAEGAIGAGFDAVRDDVNAAVGSALV